MNRFNLPLEALPNQIADSISSIEAWTNLHFIKAQDWTMKNQGWILEFSGELYKYDEQTLDDIILRLKMEFQRDPHLYTLEEAERVYGDQATLFEDIEVADNGWRIYLR